MNHKKNDTPKIVLLIIAAVLSFTLLARTAGSPELHKHEIASLEQKRINITRLTAAATSASVAVSLLPDDTATPIAENLADMTDYFLIALCAVYLEKFLITMTGFASFGVLFPIAFLLLAVRVRKKDPRLDYYAKKLIAFGIALMLVIPVSVAVSDTLEKTYQFSLEEAITHAETLEDEVEQETETAQEQDSVGFFEGLKDTADSMVGSVIDKTKDLLSSGEHILNELLEALAVLLVTSCLIPLAVLFFFLWLIRLFTNIDMPSPYPRRIGITKKMLKLPRN